MEGEIMRTNEAVKLRENEKNSTGGFVKLYAHGKIGLLFESPEGYRRVAEECIKRALKVRITVDDIAFVEAMRDQGIPEAVINKVLNSCLVFDEVHLGALSLH